jgi:hypothetical protein
VPQVKPGPTRTGQPMAASGRHRHDTPMPIVGPLSALLGSRTVSPQRRDAGRAAATGAFGATPNAQAVDKSVDVGTPFVREKVSGGSVRSPAGVRTRHSYE